MINWIINIIFIFMPPSPDRLKRLKRLLLRAGKHDIATTARVMRIRVQGVKLHIGANSFIGDETMICGASGTNVFRLRYFIESEFGDGDSSFFNK